MYVIAHNLLKSTQNLPFYFQHTVYHSTDGCVSLSFDEIGECHLYSSLSLLRYSIVILLISTRWIITLCRYSTGNRKTLLKVNGAISCTSFGAVQKIDGFYEFLLSLRGCFAGCENRAPRRRFHDIGTPHGRCL